MIYLPLRRIAEVVLSAVILVLVSPLLLVIAVCVALDGGPVLFRQARLGRNAQPFSIIKFRTMIVDADRYLDADGMPTRSRITKVGRFLRKSSLDELPQLINIVKGDMNIIGPRPILPRMLDYMTEHEKRRFQIRPGITGLSQVSGRNSIPWSKRFELDVEYVESVNLWLDTKISLLTVKSVLLSRNIVEDRNATTVDDVTTRS